MSFRRLRGEVRQLRNDIAPSRLPQFIAVSDRAEAAEVRQRIGPDAVLRLVVMSTGRSPRLGIFLLWNDRS